MSPRRLLFFGIVNCEWKLSRTVFQLRSAVTGLNTKRFYNKCIFGGPPPPLFSVLCLALPAWPRKLIDSFFLISFFSFSLVSIFFYIRKRVGFRFLNSIIGPERESRLCALSLDSVRFSSSSARLVFPDFWGKKKRQLRLKANCSGYMEEEQGH